METPQPGTEPEPASAFEKASAEKPPSLLSEFLEFLKYNKKWWILPILICLALLGVLVYITSTYTAMTPFIYTMF